MPEALSYRCPFCNCEVQVGSPCPGCAKKPRATSAPAPKPWRQDAGADGLDLPDSDFNYDEFVASEFGGMPHRRLGVAWYWWLLGVLVATTMIASWVGFFQLL